MSRNYPSDYLRTKRNPVHTCMYLILYCVWYLKYRLLYFLKYTCIVFVCCCCSCAYILQCASGVLSLLMCRLPDGDGDRLPRVSVGRCRLQRDPTTECAHVCSTCTANSQQQQPTCIFSTLPFKTLNILISRRRLM